MHRDKPVVSPLLHLAERRRAYKRHMDWLDDIAAHRPKVDTSKPPTVQRIVRYEKQQHRNRVMQFLDEQENLLAVKEVERRQRQTTRAYTTPVTRRSTEHTWTDQLAECEQELIAMRQAKAKVMTPDRRRPMTSQATRPKRVINDSGMVVVDLDTTANKNKDAKTPESAKTMKKKLPGLKGSEGERGSSSPRPGSRKESGRRSASELSPRKESDTPQKMSSRHESASEKPQRMSSRNESASEKPQKMSSRNESASENPQRVSSRNESASEKPQKVSSRHESSSEKPQMMSSRKESESEKQENFDEMPSEGRKSSKQVSDSGSAAGKRNRPTFTPQCVYSNEGEEEQGRTFDSASGSGKDGKLPDVIADVGDQHVQFLIQNSDQEKKQSEKEPQSDGAKKETSDEGEGKLIDVIGSVLQGGQASDQVEAREVDATNQDKDEAHHSEPDAQGEKHESEKKHDSDSEKHKSEAAKEESDKHKSESAKEESDKHKSESAKEESDKHKSESAKEESEKHKSEAAKEEHKSESGKDGHESEKHKSESGKDEHQSDKQNENEQPAQENSDAGKKDEHHSEAGGQEDAKVPSETVESQEPKLTDFVAAFRKTEESKPEPEKQEKPLPKLDGQPLAGILGVINTMDMSNITSNTTGQNNG